MHVPGQAGDRSPFIHICIVLATISPTFSGYATFAGARLFQPCKFVKSQAFHASPSPGVLRSQSGRSSRVTAGKSLQMLLVLFRTVTPSELSDVMTGALPPYSPDRQGNSLSSYA